MLQFSSKSKKKHFSEINWELDLVSEPFSGAICCVKARWRWRSSFVVPKLSHFHTKQKGAFPDSSSTTVQQCCCSSIETEVVFSVYLSTVTMQNANALCAAASQFVDEQLPCLTAPLWRPAHPLGTKDISHTQTSSSTVFRAAREHQVHRELSQYTSLLRVHKHFWTFIYRFAFTHTHLH